MTIRRPGMGWVLVIAAVAACGDDGGGSGGIDGGVDGTSGGDAGSDGGEEPAPTITAVAPVTLCAGGGTLTVDGTSFQDGAAISLEIPPAAATALSTTFVSSAQVSGTVPALPAGVYDVLVTNPDDQVARSAGGLTLVDAPLVFFVDPPIVHDALSIRATIHAAGANGVVQRVEIAPTGTATRQNLTDYAQDSSHPDRIDVTLPAGLAPGGYDVYVNDEACESTLVGGLTVSATTTLTLESIDHAFGWTGSDTEVTITAAGGLTETPRVYVRPQAGGLAVAGRAVVWVDAQTLTAVVPSGLAAGMYDVYVINPSGDVGALTGSAGFLVTAAAPAAIASASPSSVDAGTITPVTLTGTGFTAASTVTLTCVDASGVVITPDPSSPVTSTAGVPTSITFNAPDLAASTVCAIRVSNADGTFGEYSPMTVVTPASNLEPFVLSGTASDPMLKPMGSARRALALVEGQVSRTRRYLYAVGGDAGTLVSALDTVESTGIDAFGRMTGWASQPRTLPVPRTMMQGARVGQYLYVAGGHDGTGALDTIIRARILDPLSVPEVADIDHGIGATPGLAPGSWVYRISAVLPLDGESLPSEPIDVTVPDVAGTGIGITIAWAPVPGATGYKVYRTRSPNDAGATVAFLAAATTAQFTDDGSTSPAVSAEPPLAIGALGEWHTVATMSTPRMGAGVAAAHASGSGTSWFLYVGGGNDGANVLNSYEVLPITIDPSDQSQTTGAVTLGAKTIGTARWNVGAWSIDASVAASAGAESYVYFGTGENAASTATVTVTSAGRVSVTGELLSTAATTLDLLGPNATRSGVGTVESSGFLYDFGGGPTPATGGEGAEVCRVGLTGQCGGATTPPGLASWNSLGAGGVLVARYLNAAALDTAFIFVAGGIGGTSGTQILSSVERTIR